MHELLVDDYVASVSGMEIASLVDRARDGAIQYDLSKYRQANPRGDTGGIYDNCYPIARYFDFLFAWVIVVAVPMHIWFPDWGACLMLSSVVAVAFNCWANQVSVRARGRVPVCGLLSFLAYGQAVKRARKQHELYNGILTIAQLRNVVEYVYGPIKRLHANVDEELRFTAEEIQGAIAKLSSSKESFEVHGGDLGLLAKCRADACKDAIRELQNRLRKVEHAQRDAKAALMSVDSIRARLLHVVHASEALDNVISANKLITKVDEAASDSETAVNALRFKCEEAHRLLSTIYDDAKCHLSARAEVHS